MHIWHNVRMLIVLVLKLFHAIQCYCSDRNWWDKTLILFFWFFCHLFKFIWVYSISMSVLKHICLSFHTFSIPHVFLRCSYYFFWTALEMFQTGYVFTYINIHLKLHCHGNVRFDRSLTIAIPPVFLTYVSVFLKHFSFNLISHSHFSIFHYCSCTYWLRIKKAGSIKEDIAARNIFHVKIRMKCS